MEILPNDIVREILLRSEFKSLPRFKYVSRAWKTTITDPDFVMSHAERNNSKKFMLIYGNCSTVSISCDREGEEAAVENIKNNFDGLKYGDGLRIMGSCSGLLVGVISKPSYRLHIWNPSTREYKDVPIPNGISNADSCYGFGYARSDNTHKVLCITPRLYNELCPEEMFYSRVHLYSTRTDSWKNLTDAEYSLDQGSPMVLVNARLHCIPKGKKIILAFDTGDEDFKEMAMPDDNTDLYKDLMEFNGNLCICSWMDASERKFSVWVMNDYGVKESWAKTFCIRFDNIMYLDNLCVRARPWHIFENGKILAETHFIDKACIKDIKKLMVYDSKNYTARNLNLKLDCVRNWSTVRTYVETLISPNMA